MGDKPPIPVVDLEAEPDEDLALGKEVAEYTVIDLDAHFLESYEGVAEYMEEPWRSRILSSWGDPGSKQNATSLFPHGPGDRYQYGKVAREHSNHPDKPHDPEHLPRAMEFLGVDKQVQLSHLMLLANAVKTDDDRLPQFCKGYVEYMIDNVLDTDQGIHGLVPIPPIDLDVGLELLDRADEVPGFVGGCLITAGSKPLLGNRKYDKLYERAEDLGMPLVFHTSGSSLDDPDLAGSRTFVETHTIGFMAANQTQLTSLVLQGVPEKFPDLDIVVMESGVAYIPGLMARMDEEYLKRPEEAPLLEKRPSEYMKEFYFGTQPLETKAPTDYLETCFEMIGTDSLMYASDYPHWDFDRPTTITNLPFLSSDEKQQILAGNAQEVFDL